MAFFQQCLSCHLAIKVRFVEKLFGIVLREFSQFRSKQGNKTTNTGLLSDRVHEKNLY